MAVQSENLERLMEWLADDGSARSAHAGAEALVEKLAALVFDGDGDWPNRTDQVGHYEARLSAWFAGDDAGESRFAALTGADSDPGAAVDWFLSVVVGWEGRAVQGEAGASPDGQAPLGTQNPNFDGTPGTEFYRFDEGTNEYLYAASATDQDWAGYEQRRYAEPARNEDYGLNCRYDRTGGVYEWFDEAAGTWNDQAWADRHLAGAQASTAAEAPAGGAEPAWDEQWAMFYRVDSSGTYEFADALTPGQQSSGCGDVWLSHAEVAARAAQHSAAPATSAATVPDASSQDGPAQDAPIQDIESAAEKAVADAVAEIEDAELLTAEELAEIKAALVAEFSAGQASPAA